MPQLTEQIKPWFGSLCLLQPQARKWRGPYSYNTGAHTGHRSNSKAEVLKWVCKY